MTDDYITFSFIKNGKQLDENQNNAVCAMTVRSCGSMRFKWNGQNDLRSKKLAEISNDFGGKTFVPVELNHTKIVYDVKNFNDTYQKVGDGIITVNEMLIPTVTVADCVPVYLYEPDSGVFGIVHSGWKGTGIAGEALKLAEKKYGTKAKDFCIAIGPHIHNCCYIVDSERAEYFSNNFGSNCVERLCDDVKVDWKFSLDRSDKRLFRLSLLQANLNVLEQAGVLLENIYIHPDCTCCSKDGFYGSNRRETKKSGSPDCFTVQAAFITKN